MSKTHEHSPSNSSQQINTEMLASRDELAGEFTQISRQHVDPDRTMYERRLGMEAVSWDLHYKGHEIIENNNDRWNRSMNETNERRVDGRVELARYAIDELDDATAERINASMNSKNREMSSWLAGNMLRITRPDLGDAVDTLARMRQVDYIGAIKHVNEDGTRAVDNKMLKNFLQWHHYAMIQEQEKFNERELVVKRQFIERVEKYIDNGSIPEWVRPRLEERAGQTAVVVDDGFNTLAKGVRGYARVAAEDESAENTIMIGPLDEYDEKRNDQVFTHEMVHIIDGNADKSSHKRGLLRLYADKPDWRHGYVIFNEAITEHVADSVRKNIDIHTMDPFAKKRQGAAYPDERHILNMICNAGKRPIDVRLFIAAYFAENETDTYNGEAPMEQLVREIEQAFPGMDIINRVGEIKTRGQVRPFIEQLRTELRLPSISELEQQLHLRQSQRNKLVKRTAKVAVAAAAVMSVGGIGDQLHENIHKSSPDSQNTVVVQTSTAPADVILEGAAPGVVQNNTTEHYHSPEEYSHSSLDDMPIIQYDQIFVEPISNDVEKHNSSN